MNQLRSKAVSSFAHDLGLGNSFTFGTELRA